MLNVNFLNHFNKHFCTPNFSKSRSVDPKYGTDFLPEELAFQLKVLHNLPLCIKMEWSFLEMMVKW